MTLVRLAKEEEGVGISAGAHLAGVKSAMLMQNHGFLAVDQRHRLVRAALSHSAADADQPSRRVRRARSVADRGRRRHRRSAARAADPVRRTRPAGSRRAAASRKAQTLAALGQQPVALLLCRDLMWEERLMRRLDALTAIYPKLEDASSSRSWARSRPSCSRSATGRTSSISSTRWGSRRRWGSASRWRGPDRQVVVFDGDGSLLMNLGGLTTLARYRPRNLVHVVFDNESLLSVGGFPTATSTGSDLAGIAAAAGVPRTATVRDARRVHAGVRRGARPRAI